MATTGRGTLLGRWFRAARLDPALYGEVAADPHASVQGAFVVIVGGFAAGIGTATPGQSPLLALQVTGAIVAWLVSASLSYVIGGRLLALADTRAEFGAVLRAIAFSNAPAVLRVFGAEPSIRNAVFGLTSLWMLVASVVAVRAALRFPTIVRAAVVSALSFAAQVFLLSAVIGG